MDYAENTASSRPLALRIARALIVGVLAVLVFYLKVLGAILKFGIRAIQKAPVGGDKTRA